MNDHEYSSGLPLGTAGLNKLLGLARSAMESPKSCEMFYGLARSTTMNLIRSDRGVQELELWQKCFLHMSRLALELRKEYPAPKFEYLLVTAHRFETLEHLLNDQQKWQAAHDLPKMLELPHVLKTLVFLSNKHRLTMEAYREASGIQHTGIVSILAELRLLTWEEDEEGVVRISLTESGTQLALKLSDNG